MKNKGFLMIESIVAISLALMATALFSLIILSSQKQEKKMEEKTDQALAEHMMMKTDLQQVKIHDKIYQK